MREIRSSGCVEGVTSNRDPYSDSMGWIKTDIRAAMQVTCAGARILLRRRLKFQLASIPLPNEGDSFVGRRTGEGGCALLGHGGVPEVKAAGYRRRGISTYL
jgi:hypothetical protein